MSLLRPSPYRWLSFYYSAFFFSFGVYLPFWSLWLAWLGLSADDIGIVIGAGVMARFVVNLTITPRFHLPRHLLPAIRWLSFLGAVAGFVHLAASPNLFVLSALSVFINCVIGPSIPVTDAIANHYHRRKLLDYGRARVWGSIAFIVGSTVTGWLVEEFGAGIIVPVAATAMLVGWGLSLMTPHPSPKGEETDAPDRPPLLSVLKAPHVITFMVIVSLLQSSHAAYYAFSSIHWTQSGLADSTVGYLWSLGVGVEVLMFAVCSRFFGDWSVQTLFRVAALSVIIRWTLTAWSTDVNVLILAQSLHGFTFGITHIAAMRYIQQQPAERIMALQALYNALALGAVMALVTMLSGELYSSFSGSSFFVMAAFGLPVLFLSLPASKQEAPSEEATG
ncbi:3-phenylpropionic acid transporter [Enterovibrio norvegicus]|uniref:MFS transporter, PPP family, 3-phenylpropionic acid transporter n=2 Tax=Enterovibrio norvegicus TaxID=188144 RepID=A0A1I5UJZ1_9GAMM|nr:3-phenylpropionate MFS transporter [Enterovibrio norvegicus]MCC4798843.1 3-phenylpropionate MFS transporter [Enterovibrio norvegicus]OEF60803.1 3-phenylpropionic acid transporter [Enterovibrio norvegicus]PMI28153.1 3-phenylpropionic acid transporter [Enterovibrio norvegicus]PMI35066.1 3-phenylpropionic acid transporter [Enterovibrio norvegicus]PMN46262.1 3-phenylpropionic acid transporter [Enterovibrio norvegicus]